MKNVVNRALGAKKKIFLLAFVALFSSIYTWADWYKLIDPATETLSSGETCLIAILNRNNGRYFFVQSDNDTLRLGQTVTDSIVINPNSRTIWTASKSNSLWTFYCARTGKYLYNGGGSSSTLNAISDNPASWDITNGASYGYKYFKIAQGSNTGRYICWSSTTGYLKTESNINWSSYGVQLPYNAIQAGNGTLHIFKKVYTPASAYTVTFNAGSGTCGTENLSEASAGAGVTLPSATPSASATLDGYTFVGWATTSVDETRNSPTLYKAGSKYYPTNSHTLHAVYAIISNNYRKVTDTDSLSPGKYVIVNATYQRALKAKTKETYYLDTAHVSISNNIITAPSKIIIWDVTKKDNTYHFYNDSTSTWLESSDGSSTPLYYLQLCLRQGKGYRLSINGSGYAIFASNNASNALIYYPTNSVYRFAAYSSAGTKNIQLYKQDNTYNSNPGVTSECSDWSLHYGTDGQADWDEACFTYTGSSNEWQIEDFVIPNKPNWYVDNAAGNDERKTLSTWSNLYFAASQGDGDCPMVGDAIGAIGTVRIYDNSNWNNRYAGFIPNGYVLKIGSNEYSFVLEDGNEYRSEIIEYSGSNARDNVSVGIEDADGHFISTDNTSEMQHIFLNTGGTDLWSTAGVTNFGLYDVTNGNWACLMTAVPGVNYLYEGWVPSNCTTVSIHRLASSNLKWKTNDGDASNTNVYNSTNDLVLQDNQNLWTVTGWGGGDGNWSAYTQKGRFCIWQNSIEKNWGVCFRPCYEFNNTAGDGNWNTAGNWKPQSVPTIDFDVFLNKPVTVNVTTAQAKSVIINQEGDNTGQLVVDAGQKLIVAETIQKTTDGETYSATEANDIIIHSDATHGLGALVMGTHDGTNQATVNFTTLSNGTSEDNTSIAQYVGTPFNDETNILHNWYNSWVYGIDHTGGIIGWERVNEGQGMAPFKGYCVFSADGTHHNYWQQGTLVASENQTISGLNWQSGEGTANPNNENLLANSWMAPIKINAMEASDFTNTEATIYIFNSTSASAYTSLASNYSSYTPGTAGDAIIPSMQSFSVFTNAAGGSSVALDYNKIVYQPALSGTVPGPNRAPLREAAEEANKLRLFVRTESGYGDLLYMWERSDFSDAFENGWDGHKLFGESVAPQLFALSPDGDLAINCIPTFEGVQMGFKAGEQDNSYTLTFEYSDEAQPLYLLDIQTNIYTQITSATSYSFTTTDTEVHNRFVLTYNAPSTPTALETTPAVTTGKKVIYDNHLFILHNGRIFSAQGAMIQ